MTPASARRNQLVTVAMVFAVFTGFAFVLPFLPLFVRELGVEEPERAALWAGVLIGVAPLLAGLLAPVWGRLADRHGHKSIAVKALVVLRRHPRPLRRGDRRRAAARLRDRASACSAASARWGWPWPPHRRRARRPAARSASSRPRRSSPPRSDPFAGGLLADAIGIRRTFLVTAALCALALVLVLVFYEEPATRRGRRPGRDRASARWWRCRA